METVTIIITAHNEGDNVRRTVESILANTHSTEFEIVLIDDGSTDDSFRFLEGGAHCTDTRVRRFRFERSVGLIRARHEGVRRAGGDCIVFLDAHTAVLPGWLTRLTEALERWGPHAVITPDISVLNEATWSPGGSSGGIVAINETLDIFWRDPIYPTGLVPTVVGCCWILPRRFYYQVGGFDLGLRRWGCENIDLTLKAYAAGGACYLEPSVLVGHLFRGEFPYPVRNSDMTYNKLRTGYVHFSDGSFRRLLDHLRNEPGFPEAVADFRADLSELDHLRRMQRLANRRHPDWFVRMFLPALSDEA